MAKWILVVLSVVMFVLAGIGHFRQKALVAEEKARIAADNAGRASNTAPGQPVLVEGDPDVAGIQADALGRGEVWFLTTPAGWCVLGVLMLVLAVVMAAVSRRRSGAKPSS